MESDLPPTPFGKDHRELALRLKQAGLAWKPHVGCFVWDREGLIPADSPFPDRVYFILNLGHFLRLLGTAERVRERLVWLPTWHQARLAAEKLGVDEKALRDICMGEKDAGARRRTPEALRASSGHPGEELDGRAEDPSSSCSTTCCSPSAWPSSPLRAPAAPLTAISSPLRSSTPADCFSPRPGRPASTATSKADARVALLVDNRQNEEADFHAALAATALGTAVELAGEERERGIARYIGKFPYLEDFVRSPSCALFRVDVERYIVVTKFQNVIEVSP